MHTPRSFGPYRLLKKIAVGGMAEIYLATRQAQSGDEKLLALKMILERYASDEDLIEALVNESRIAVQLDHPNIVQVFDLAQREGRYFVTMEFVDGRDLSLLLERVHAANHRLPFAAAVYVAREVARGLDYAHRRRDARGLPLHIVHRDISPQNVLLSFDGAVKVTDFGIAKANVERSETQVGVLKGKFYYMSPEQAWGDEVDGRSDVYSLGAVLFEMLTGRMLHSGRDRYRVLEAVRGGDVPSPASLRPDLPTDLEAIVLHALERDRSERFESADALVRELTAYLERLHGGYGREQLAACVQSYFPDERWQITEELRALGPQASAAPETLGPVLMGRDDYEPPEGSSLVFDLAQMERAAAAFIEDAEVSQNDDPLDTALTPPKGSPRPSREPNNSHQHTTRISDTMLARLALAAHENDARKARKADEGGGQRSGVTHTLSLDELQRITLNAADRGAPPSPASQGLPQPIRGPVTYPADSGSLDTINAFEEEVTRVQGPSVKDEMIERSRSSDLATVVGEDDGAAAPKMVASAAGQREISTGETRAVDADEPVSGDEVEVEVDGDDEGEAEAEGATATARLQANAPAGASARRRGPPWWLVVLVLVAAVAAIVIAIALQG